MSTWLDNEIRRYVKRPTMYNIDQPFTPDTKPNPVGLEFNSYRDVLYNFEVHQFSKMACLLLAIDPDRSRQAFNVADKSPGHYTNAVNRLNYDIITDVINKRMTVDKKQIPLIAKLVQTRVVSQLVNYCNANQPDKINAICPDAALIDAFINAKPPAINYNPLENGQLWYFDFSISPIEITANTKMIAALYWQGLEIYLYDTGYKIVCGYMCTHPNNDAEINKPAVFDCTLYFSDVMSDDTDKLTASMGTAHHMLTLLALYADSAQSDRIDVIQPPDLDKNPLQGPARPSRRRAKKQRRGLLDRLRDTSLFLYQRYRAPADRFGRPMGDGGLDHAVSVRGHYRHVWRGKKGSQRRHLRWIDSYIKGPAGDPVGKPILAEIKK